MLVLVTHQSSAKTIARVKSQAQAQQQWLRWFLAMAAPTWQYSSGHRRP